MQNIEKKIFIILEYFSLKKKYSYSNILVLKKILIGIFKYWKRILKHGNIKKVLKISQWEFFRRKLFTQYIRERIWKHRNIKKVLKIARCIFFKRKSPTQYIRKKNLFSEEKFFLKEGCFQYWFFLFVKRYKKNDKKILDWK